MFHIGYGNIPTPLNYLVNYQKTVYNCYRILKYLNYLLNYLMQLFYYNCNLNYLNYLVKNHVFSNQYYFDTPTQLNLLANCLNIQFYYLNNLE